MPDFFISYTAADRAWAEWIGHILEEEGFGVILQAWDFRPGNNFVLEMQRAASSAARTLMVLSPDYLKSQFGSSEWAAALSQDPQGLNRKLLPVMVRRCSPPALLAPIVHIDLVEQNESSARDLLIQGVDDRRAKPARRPTFPGAPDTKTPNPYPGRKSPTSETPSKAYIPKVRRPTSDFEKLRFMRGTFDLIKGHFRAGLDDLAKQADGIEYDLQETTATEFAAEIFSSGKSISRCRIWQGGMLSADGISYAEGHGHFGGNSCNEMLSFADGEGEPRLSSLMGDGFGSRHGQIDLKRMTPDQAADCLWRRFVAPLER